MNRRGRRPDDRGAVAVIVALTVTLVLIPVAALAVDLGSLYVREAALQQIADDAATAGASELAVLQRDEADGTTSSGTVMATARARTVAALCALATAGGGWPDACSGSQAWAGDGDEANGEVSFYRGAPSAANHVFDLTQDANGAASGELITGVRVVTPPSRVTFGLAGAITDGHADTRRSATAGLFTVLPRAGFFPMFLRPADEGTFCTRSAPKSIWESTYNLTGCNAAVARGNLTAPRTASTENAYAMTWNTATGFDREHLPLRGLTATLQSQSPYSRVRDLSPGLFGGGGGATARLKSGGCPGSDYNASSGPYSGLESAYLTSFVDPRVGDEFALRTAITAGSPPAPAQYGLLDGKVLRCGRLAVVPVLTGLQDPLPYTGLTSSSLVYPVTGLRLIWLDDRLRSGEDISQRAASGPCLYRGFYWGSPDSSWCQNDAMRAYTGYILDPRLLPATVSGANAANALPQFVGSGLPVTVRLLRDVADPPAR